MRIIIGALAALALSASVAEAQERRLRDWTVGQFRILESSTGCFMYADLNIPGAEPISFTLTLSHDHKVFSVDSPDGYPFYRAGTHPVVVVFMFHDESIEESSVRDINAHGYVNRGKREIAIDVDERFIRDFSRFDVLGLIRDSQLIAVLDLDGSGPAVTQLRSCAAARYAEIYPG